MVWSETVDERTHAGCVAAAFTAQADGDSGHRESSTPGVGGKAGGQGILAVAVSIR